MLLPQSYYGFMLEEKPNTYTEGLGTFVDQADGLADHFEGTVAGINAAAESTERISSTKNLLIISLRGRLLELMI